MKEEVLIIKQTTNMQRSIQYLNKIFKELNKEYFGNQLPMPIITIQSTPKAYGHFTPWDAYRIKDDKGETSGAVEINIGAGTLDRPIENVTATLLHEMVHYYCYLADIKDTSRGGAYHNKRFKAEAEARGLVIDYDSRIGWSITSPSEELLDFIIGCGFEDIRIGRNEYTSFFIGGGAKAVDGNGKNTTTTTTKKKGNSIKWVCPCCGAIVRSTKVLNIVCGDCNEQFIQA